MKTICHNQRPLTIWHKLFNCRVDVKIYIIPKINQWTSIDRHSGIVEQLKFRE